MNRTLYLLCTTSRSGSTHLCRLLAATGRLGAPDEYFNEPLMSETIRGLQLTNECEYVEHIFKNTSTPNGVCGIKLATDAFARLRAALGPRLEALSPKCLWLRRRDALRQAISLYRAEATGMWHWAGSGARPIASAPFDAARIRACQEQIAAANQEWSRWFAQADAAPLKLWYEDLAADPAAIVRAVCRHVGVADAPLPPTASGLRILRDQLTQAWAARLDGTA